MICLYAAEVVQGLDVDLHGNDLGICIDHVFDGILELVLSCFPQGCLNGIPIWHPCSVT